MSQKKKGRKTRAQRLFEDHGVVVQRMPEGTNTKVHNPKKGDAKKDRRRFREELKQYYG